MKIQVGRISEVDAISNTGIITACDGREYFFNGLECFDQKLPPRYSVVTFIRDPDYRTTLVATAVKIDQLPEGIDALLANIDE